MLVTSGPAVANRTSALELPLNVPQFKGFPHLAFSFSETGEALGSRLDLPRPCIDAKGYVYCK
jgi:hypothetical protein